MPTPGGDPDITIGAVRREALVHLENVKSEHGIGPVVAGVELDVAARPQRVPRSLVTQQEVIEIPGEVKAAVHVDQRLITRWIERGVQRHDLVDLDACGGSADRHHVDPFLLDQGAGVDVVETVDADRGTQSHLQPTRQRAGPQPHPVLVTAGFEDLVVVVVQLLVALDPMVVDLAVDARTNLQRFDRRWVMYFDDHALGCQVGVGHVDEPGLGDPNPVSGPIDDLNVSFQHPASQVQLLAVLENFHVSQAKPLRSIDAEGDGEPVRLVDQVLVLDLATVDGAGGTAVPAGQVRSGVVHLIGLCPCGRSAGDEHTVAERAQRFSQALLRWNPGVVGEDPSHR